MKFNKNIFFILKSYKCKEEVKQVHRKLHKMLWTIIISSTFLVGCNKRETLIAAPVQPLAEAELKVQDENNKEEELRLYCLNIAYEYKDIIANMKEKNNGTVDKISQEAKDEIEKYLFSKGYPIINSNSKYPSYLENAQSFYDFWKAISKNEDAEQKVFLISEMGGLTCWCFQYHAGKKYYTSIQIEWNEQNEPFCFFEENKEVIDWEMSEQDHFYFQLYSEIRCMDTYSLIRLKPVDENLYNLTEKYISPIGYLSHNMFLCDWSSEDCGQLCFNDLFEYFYKIRTGEYFYTEEDQNILEPYLHVDIPKSLFEETLLPYFNISLDEFRKSSIFDEQKEVYPWQEVYCGNTDYYPYIEPDVNAYHENEDGTLTLVVNARCNSYKTDRLFVHEVVINPLEEGAYQYISNKITWRGEHKLPVYSPRISPN